MPPHCPLRAAPHPGATWRVLSSPPAPSTEVQMVSCQPLCPWTHISPSHTQEGLQCPGPGSAPLPSCSRASSSWQAPGRDGETPKHFLYGELPGKHGISGHLLCKVHRRFFIHAGPSSYPRMGLGGAGRCGVKEEAWQDKSHLSLKKWIDSFKPFFPKGNKLM